MLHVSFSSMKQMYYVEYRGTYQSWSIARKLRMTKLQYALLLKRCGAVYSKLSSEFYFEDINLALNAIEKLELVILMNKLEG